MDTKQIIAELDSEIARLQQVRNVLSGTPATPFKAKRGRPRKAVSSPVVAAPTKRTLSPEARLKIAAAQKARWAKFNKAKKAA